MSNKNAVTLIELIIAISLLGVVLLTGATMDIAARKLFKVSDRQAELQNEINPVLLRVKRDLNMAVGNVNDPGVVMQAANSRIAIRRDVNSTPSDYSDDVWMTYDRVGNQIQFYRDTEPQDWIATSTPETIANRITSFTFANNTTPFTTGETPPLLNLRFTVTAFFNPSLALGPENPQLTVSTSAHALTHSGR